MSKKQTSVEWLIEKLKSQYDIDIERLSITDKAISMEKEQIMKFAKTCLDKALDLDIRTAYSQVEQYHKETYGN